MRRPAAGKPQDQTLRDEDAVCGRADGRGDERRRLLLMVETGILQVQTTMLLLWEAYAGDVQQVPLLHIAPCAYGRPMLALSHAVTVVRALWRWRGDDALGKRSTLVSGSCTPLSMPCADTPDTT